MRGGEVSLLMCDTGCFGVFSEYSDLFLPSSHPLSLHVGINFGPNMAATVLAFLLFFLNVFCLFVCLFYIRLYCPNGISLMGNSGCLPLGKASCERVALPSLWCVLGVLVFP